MQNGWSISHMRHERWETLGTLDGQQPGDDVVSSELDEDFEPGSDAASAGREVSRSMSDVQSGPREEGPDFGEEGPSVSDVGSGDHGPALGRTVDSPGEGLVDYVRPFAELTDLPDDLSAAFEAFKLAILHHKLDNWQQISRDDVLASLEALKQLTVAP